MPDRSYSPKIVLALIEKNKKFLLIKRRVAGITELRWAFPGGTVGEAESDEQAVLRQAKTEVGLQIDIKKKLLERTHPIHILAFLIFIAYHLPTLLPKLENLTR